MKFCRCDRCNIPIMKYRIDYYSRVYSLYVYPHKADRYTLCTECFHEFDHDGYFDMWYSFYLSENYELADKFLLDFLGKLN